VSPLKRALDATLGPLFPRIQVPNGIRAEMLTRNDMVRHAYPRDPLIHHVATPHWFREARGSGTRTMAAAAALAVPTLFLTPGHDRIVSVEAQERFIAAAPDGMATQNSYPALMHEIFLEPERSRVITDLIDWLVAASAPRAGFPAVVHPTRSQS
jgi:alpha-beta hydrolase superfamily lysophospholipase